MGPIDLQKSNLNIWIKSLNYLAHVMSQKFIFEFQFAFFFVLILCAFLGVACYRDNATCTSSPFWYVNRHATFSSVMNVCQMVARGMQ